MASTPCKGLKKDGTPCRGNGLEQLDGYCIAHAPADKAWHWRSHGGKASPASRLPSCAENLLPNLSHISRILSHISRTSAPACATPSTAAKKASSAACARPPRPRRRPSPAARLTRCAQNFLPNLSFTLMELSYISRTCAPACQPLQPPQKGLQRGPYAATTRGLRQPPRLPCCAQDFLTNLSYISRILTYISLTRAPACTTPSTAAKGPPARPVPSPRRDAGGLRLPPTTPGAGGPDPGPTPENGRQPGRVTAAAPPLLVSRRLHLNQDAI